MTKSISKPIVVFDKGEGSPTLGFVACTHGDETIGLKAMAVLRDVCPMRGRIIGILAHPGAVANKKRFFKTDLNRSFPGKRNGSGEQKLARHILQTLRACTAIVDIHGTNANIDSLAIVTKWNSTTKSLLGMLPIRKVMYSSSRVFAKGALISNVPVGVAIEYGPDKSGLRYGVTVRHLKCLLRNNGIIPGRKMRYSKKVLYSIIGTYNIPKKFAQSSSLKEFRYIKKGQYIGRTGKKKLFATTGFYPIFMGKGRYPGVLALMANRQIVTV